MTVNRRIVSILTALIMALAMVPVTTETAHADETMTWSDLKTALEAGGTVTMTNDITRDSGDSIPISSEAVLDLNGFTLDGAGESYRYQPLFNITKDTGKLTIKDDSQEKKGTVQNVIGTDMIIVDGEFNLESGTLKGTVMVHHSGSFTMAGGTVSSNKYNDVVYVYRGSFAMTGGVIDGGGIDGGGNHSGVFLNDSSFIMRGGMIKKCGTGVGYGISSPSFTMTGGIITECNVGVQTSINGSITIGGNAVIAGNAEKNLCLVSVDDAEQFQPLINIGDDLSEDASIGIWFDPEDEKIHEMDFVILTNSSNQGFEENTMFFSDIEGYTISLKNNSEFLLVKSEADYPVTNNPLKVKGKTATVKYSKLKKRSQILKVSSVIKTIKKGKGKMSYKYVSAKKGKKSFKKYFKVNKKNGRVTVKKGLKKGTYKVTVKVRAAGNKEYLDSSWKKVIFRIRVK